MSFHVLTLSEAGVRLSVERGLLVCHWKDTNTTKTLPLDDIRLIVVQTPHASFTQPALCALLERNVVVLHLNAKNRVVGYSAPLHKTLSVQALQGQVQSWNTPFQQETLWDAIKHQKLWNQSHVLDLFGLENKLKPKLEAGYADEAALARLYWQQWFWATGGKTKTRERLGAMRFENKALNYAYAIIGGLTHQALLAYGLLPQLGVHHALKRVGTPLVWDVMEPLRPFVDLLVLQYLETYPCSAEERLTDAYWQRFYQSFLVALRAVQLAPKKPMHTLKLLDAPTAMARTLARCFETQSAGKLWLPSLPMAYWHTDPTTTGFYPERWFTVGLRKQQTSAITAADIMDDDEADWPF